MRHELHERGKRLTKTTQSPTLFFFEFAFSGIKHRVSYSRDFKPLPGAFQK